MHRFLSSQPQKQVACNIPKLWQQYVLLEETYEYLSKKSCAAERGCGHMQLHCKPLAEGTTAQVYSLGE